MSLRPAAAPSFAAPVLAAPAFAAAVFADPETGLDAPSAAAVSRRVGHEIRIRERGRAAGGRA